LREGPSVNAGGDLALNMLSGLNARKTRVLAEEPGQSEMHEDVSEGPSAKSWPQDDTSREIKLS
jgi:hypothetical protein